MARMQMVDITVYCFTTDHSTVAQLKVLWLVSNSAIPELIILIT